MSDNELNNQLSKIDSDIRKEIDDIKEQIEKIKQELSNIVNSKDYSGIDINNISISEEVLSKLQANTNELLEIMKQKSEDQQNKISICGTYLKNTQNQINDILKELKIKNEDIIKGIQQKLKGLVAPYICAKLVKELIPEYNKYYKLINLITNIEQFNDLELTTQLNKILSEYNKDRILLKLKDTLIIILMICLGSVFIVSIVWSIVYRIKYKKEFLSKIIIN